MLQAHSPHGRHMAATLNDGEWHLGRSLIVDAALSVPYGDAVRAAETDRRRQRAKREREGQEPTLVEDDPRRYDAFTAGSRLLARGVLTRWARIGKLERRGTGAEREYRIAR